MIGGIDEMKFSYEYEFLKDIYGHFSIIIREV
jgi:hypothetical protein